MSTTLESIADVRNRLDGERTAMVTTLDERGELSARPLTVQTIDDDGAVWFLVDGEAAWVSPSAGSAINVAIVDEGSTWVSFAGRAELIEDRSRIEEFCGPISSAYFEGGSEPVALRAATDRIEWWTAAGSITKAVELTKATLADSTPDLGESGTIEA